MRTNTKMGEGMKGMEGEWEVGIKVPASNKHTFWYNEECI